MCIFISYYFILRYNQKKIQKKYDLDNFEIWVYTNLIDYYKSKGFPFPRDRAMQEILRIRKWININ